MRWRGCRIRSGGMQLHGIDGLVAGPGAINTAIWTKPTATEPKVPLMLSAISKRLMVPPPGHKKKPGLAGPGFCYRHCRE